MTEDYCKLASGIILSTIWREDDHTRILWITMLAVKDRHHRVLASLPGLAAVANIPIESCKLGLQKLSDPDEYSRTKDHQGRRIEAIDGGWLVLNGEKYRNYMSKAERNEYQRALMAERRATAKELASVSSPLAPLAQAEAEAKADSETVPPEEPTRKKKAGFTDGSASALIPTTPQSQRIATIFHRKLTTAWQPNEVAAYKRLGSIPEEDLAAVERYYAANWPPRRDVNILRHDLITFLNNFQGEVDRAHVGPTRPQEKPVPRCRV